MEGDGKIDLINVNASNVIIERRGDRIKFSHSAIDGHILLTKIYGGDWVTDYSSLGGARRPAESLEAYAALTAAAMKEYEKLMNAA